MNKPPLLFLLPGAIGAFYGWAVFVSTFHYPGSIGLNYNAPGTDFMVFDTAIRLAMRGDLATLYDGDRFTAWLNQDFQGHLREALPFRPWIYPPPFLLFLLPFSLAGFYLSYTLFQVSTAGVLAASLHAGSIDDGRRAWWTGCAVLSCPAASVVVVSGQSSFLIAALLIGGATVLDRRPVLAGIIFGVLTIKPQFFLLVPVVLIARRAWYATAVGVATFLLMAAAAAALFGFRIWTEWFPVIAESTSGSDPRWLSYGRVWGESVFTCALLLGAGTGLATTAQWVATLLGAACVWRAFRGPMALAPRTAVLLAAALLAAPHSGGYDLLLLVAASALFLSHLGLRATRPDWWLGFFAGIEPLFGVPAVNVICRFGPVLTLALLGRIFWREAADAKVVAPVDGAVPGGRSRGQ